MAVKLRWCRWQGIGFMLAAMLFGCSADHLPNAPRESAGVQMASPAPQNRPTSAPIRIALAPPARTKPVGDLSASEIKEKVIGRFGGIISIAHEDTHAMFAVPPRALGEPVTIRMQVFGSGLQSIVEFGPSGLHFNRPCALSITFPAEGIDPDALGGYLINDDGTATEVPAKVVSFGNLISVVIQVDHFSQYSSDDGEEGGA